MVLTKEIREKLQDGRIKMLIALELDVSFATLNRWFLHDNEKLSTLRAINAIRKHTGYKGEIFVKESA